MDRMTTNDPVLAAIEADVKQHKIILYMKGTASFPQCGFSQRAVAILKGLNVPFETRNVLADPALRDGIKRFSNWPTIPQVYIGGKFVGGSDIVLEMSESGELKKLVEETMK
jgi:monothiol glutaredoxin